MLSFITPRISKLYPRFINSSFLFGAICLAALLLQTSDSFGQHCVDPDSIQSKGAAPQAGCGGGNSGGGNGGGGGGTPSGNLTWGTPNDQPDEGVSGAPQRFGVGATIFTPNGSSTASLYVAWTSTQVVDSAGDAQVLLGNSTAGGADYQNQTTIVDSAGNTLVGGGNPALTSFKGVLYVADEDVAGNASFLYSMDGLSWSPTINCGGGFTGSVSIVPFNGSIYMAMENVADQSLTLCVIPDESIQKNRGIAPTTQNFPGVDTAFVAGLGTFTPPGGASTLYIAYETEDNSHNIYYYTTTDGVNFTFSAAAAGDQSSTTPSLVSHNGILQMGFRSNNGNHTFLTKFSTDGVNWSPNTNTGIDMGGPPMLVDSAANPLPGSPENGDIFNIYVANDPSQIIWTVYAH